MAYADDLLQLARGLAHLDDGSQAALRRAMSTAYYALFHLLVSDAASNWANTELRPKFGRLFQHGRMKGASSELRVKIGKLLSDGTPTSQDRVTQQRLAKVAETFVEIQQKREVADYDTGKTWAQQD